MPRRLSASAAPQLSLFGANGPDGTEQQPSLPDQNRTAAAPPVEIGEPFAPVVERWAEFSPDGAYRYLLGRAWAPGPRALWILGNPSSAGADRDDPTVTRLIARTRALGATGYLLWNPWPFVATDPDELWAQAPATRAGWWRCRRCGTRRPLQEWPRIDGATQCGPCFAFGRHVDQLELENEHWLREALAAAQALVVVGWGKAPARRDHRDEHAQRTAHVLQLLREARRFPWCLGTNADGSPKHPLYLPYGARLELFGEVTV